MPRWPFQTKRMAEILRPTRRRSQAQAPRSCVEEFIPAPIESFDDDPLLSRWQQQRDNDILQQRDRWQEKTTDAERICQQAADRLDRHMALVPQGRASLHRTLTDNHTGDVLELEIEPFLIDIHTVTNTRYQKFVDAGGYEDLSLWAESVWPHLIQMRDQTARPAPRYWRDARHHQRLSEHPVVGISWYEAMAFATWIGQRLPIEAERQMVATWRVKSETDVLYRYPWGDAMDRKKCNIWASGHGTTMPVGKYENGAAPNGVLQLTGNVWEWVDNDFEITTEEGVNVIGEMTMKSTCGGAFDTYFESQATSLFRTGHNALTRTHNVGFRCALSLTDAPWLADNQG